MRLRLRTMTSIIFCLLLTLLHKFTFALRFEQQYVGYNLNENQTAVKPKDYWGQWDNHTYHPSPANWRFPVYVLTLDRYIDGDPTNNEANGTVFEHNWMSNQFRFGGDVAGVLSDLDYIQGLGIKAIYFTGSMFLNMPWSADGYGPLDLTLLDQHHGNIEEWRSLITEIHARGMYAIMDNTMATMGNLLAFGNGYTNVSVPFNWDEYDYLWKYTDRRYHDFHPSNTRNSSCQYPRIFEQDGYLLPQTLVDQQHGCRSGEFDMYGDIAGTGAYESYQNQLSRFASVQDRLREWQPDTLEKIKILSCMQIAMLDIDGFRMDKAVQTTLDAMAEWSDYQRQCARQHGKDNFLVVGEIVANNKLAATYVGRGKQPHQMLDDPASAVSTDNATNPDSFVRPFGMTALDGAAFHYDVYGSMTRFLGLDSPWGSLGVDWVEMYHHYMLATQDLVNANTGLFDPRHMYGTTNQDVFRWPALANGTQRQLLGLFVTTLELPGIPMVYFGEEQAYYVLESLAPDYVFGRTPFASSRAWQLHGCYNLGEDIYVNMPFNSSSYGCHDDSVSLDHRDPSHPLRNYLKRMFELRNIYPTLNDGFNLTTLSTRIYNIHLPGSGNLPSPTGIWSVYRGRNEQVQDFAGTGQGNQGVWLVFTNENRTVTYDFECSSTNTTAVADGPLIAAFDTGTVIKNLFYPYEEYTLQPSKIHYGLEKSIQSNGCIPQLTLRPWDFKAFVPKSSWKQPAPVITHVSPTHDSRLLSNSAYDQTQNVTIQIQFSEEMDCTSVTNSISIDSKTQSGKTAVLSGAQCESMVGIEPMYPGYVTTAWVFTATLTNVADGVHTYTVRNATSKNGLQHTGSNDRFMFRIGQTDNPMVFPLSSNYSTTLLYKNPVSSALSIAPRAAGADRIRYSTNWGTSFSKWTNYTGENITIQKQEWSGTPEQAWTGEHVVVHYWSQITGSSDHVQHADLSWTNRPARRWPHAWVEGIWNQFGTDGGIKNKMVQNDAGLWSFDLFSEWPTNISVNVWGMNPNGLIDKSASFGDVDYDGVLDWLPPDSLANNAIRVTTQSMGNSLGYRLLVNDGTYGYTLAPIGSPAVQAVVMAFIVIIPPLTAVLGVLFFIRFFYRVKFNKIGIDPSSTSFPSILAMRVQLSTWWPAWLTTIGNRLTSTKASKPNQLEMEHGGAVSAGLVADASSGSRRTVLIATLEYDIADWNIKVKIGGLGVMANLMAHNLRHQDLVWVVPCLGDIDYPLETAVRCDPFEVVILGQHYFVSAYQHVIENITYIILDAPIFRTRTKAEPYPPRMDDLESGVYYSVWNQCIAVTIDRFRPDIYHINDYHGALAPLYILPEVIPCCLSLHNAEFQGLWNLKSRQEMQETCKIFNLEEFIVKKYVQYGEIFNLLHAGASYLRIHQAGFGAVGVSSKYSKRSSLRYPIFWGLGRIGSLPNPDPTDIAPVGVTIPQDSAVVDLVWEEQRSNDRVKAQEWAGLNIDKNADLFIFVGRWSSQKGIDLIADVFYSVLQSHESVQLICVGPVIDLHGKFAALKLSKLMDQFPGRVYSKPEFTMLPPYIFSGAEFALMPSRDEPFGLVAVEFGRKGALCVGSRVGGLGSMPGWWFTVESSTSKHLLSQFKAAISDALESNQATRQTMRAYSKLQRFPVAQWVEDLNKLQSRSIKASLKAQSRKTLFHHHGRSPSRPRTGNSSSLPSGATTPQVASQPPTPMSLSVATTPSGSRTVSRTPSMTDLHGSFGLRSFPASSLSESSTAVMPTSTVLDNPPESVTPPGPYNRTGKRVCPTSFQFVAKSTTTSRRASIGSEESFPVAAHAGPSISSTPTRMSEDIENASGPFHDSGNGESESFVNALELSLISKGMASDSSLNTLVPTFDDKNHAFYDEFSHKIDHDLNAKSSERKLCIEEYLIKSEKKWFDNYHTASLQNTQSKSTAPLLKPLRLLAPSRYVDKRRNHETSASLAQANRLSEYDDYFGNSYTAPHGIQKLMQRKIGTWSLYCLLLAFGQIISANSYQLTLLTGSVGQPAVKLYILSSTYLVSSAIWWLLYRKIRAVYVLSLPFFFFGLAFFLLGMSILTKNPITLGRIYDGAAALYAVGSSAGTLFFALNFGTEGGTPSRTWAFRACAIGGTQQLFIAFLWYWGSYLVNFNGTTTTHLVSSSAVLTGVTIPLGIFMWGTGILLLLGLPGYYRQTPGAIPSFYFALCRRGIVLWFWVYVILSGYWLSNSYNRNWQFLWTSLNAPRWAVALIVIFFFIGVWAALLITLATLSKKHSWIIPIFAIGLGAPRWCQYLWALSGIAHHIPWASNLAVGALLSRAVWSWLGVLDGLQGVGFGMILLMTLTRTHIAFTLIMSQIIGALVTILARATAPNRVIVSNVFINLANDSLANVWFWVALICQLIICVGFFKFFRKSQLQKP